MKITLPHFLRLALAGCVLTAVTLAAQANTAIDPKPREAGWVKRHEGFVEIAKRGDSDVLFLGDSITDGWRNPDPSRGVKPIWDQHFAPLKAANFGISGDRTQHLLWRLQNGELDGIRPKVVVLMIGTNNTGFEADRVTPKNTPAEAAEGVRAIVQHLRTKLPAAKILLLAVFPRGETADNPGRLQVAAINQSISRLHDGKSVIYLDIGAKFLGADGRMSKEVMPDFLHPNAKGYEIWANAIKAPLAKLLQ
ncbi:MAG: hypothetical protein RIQ93_1667 [Verrucomicrobiota bacterium]|jgi:lysophospholipase L1-like esterase